MLNSTSVSYTATADDVSMLDVLSELTDAIDALSDFSATLADDLTIEVTSTSPFTADTSDNKVAFTAVEIPFAPGDKWSIVVNGTTVEYTAQASDQRLSDIASGLSGLIDGQATVTSTVDASGDIVITASQPFTATSADSKIGLTATEVPFAIGDTWEVEIDGTTFSTSATASQQTLAEIATALALLIDADPNLTAAATDDAINVTGTAFEATTSDAKVTLSKPDNPLTVNIVKTGSNATITRTDGGSWIDDGFVQDMVLQIFSQTPESPSQNESDAETELPILSVTDSVITIGDASGFVDETGVDVIVQQRFAYTLSAADIRLVTSTIKIWTEDELLSLISAGLLKPITDTQAADEDVNIDAAGHVTIVAAGNIGTATGRAAIDLDNLSQDDRVVLAAAERTDVAFLKKTPVSATVDFGDTGSTGDTITRTDGGDWIADGLVVGEYIEVWGEVANATPGGTYYEIATVSTDTITLVVDDSLSNESGVTITVAPIVLDPVADANDVIGLSVDLREDIDVDAGTSISVSAGGMAYLGSEQDIIVDSVAAGQAVRLKSGQNVTDSGATATNVTATDLVVEAAQGGIGSQADPLTTNLAANGGLTARALNDVHITESAGNMNVESVFSQTGGAYLTTNAGSIVDALDHNFENIVANTLVLTTVGGGVGESGDYLEIDLPANAVTTITSAGDVYLNELVGNLNVDVIQSTTGDVDLVSQVAILDSNDTAAANVIGNNIKLTATTGTLGVPNNDLDIDSSFSATGKLTTSSNLNSYLIETAGDLNVGTIGTGAGQTAFIFAPEKILNGNSDGSSNVSSGLTRLFAGDDIGTSSKSLLTTVGFMEGYSTAGAVYITNQGHATVGGLDQSAGFTAPGEVDITALSPVTIAKDILTTGIVDVDGATVLDNGDIIITATDDANDTPGNEDNIIIRSGVTIRSDRGKVILRAGDNIIIEDGATISGANGVEFFIDYGNADSDPGRIQILGDVDGLNVLIEGDSQNDIIDIDDAIIAPSITVDGLGGDDQITINTSLNASSGDIRILGGTGQDDLIVSAIGSLTAGSITFDGGSEDDDIQLLGTIQATGAGVTIDGDSNNPLRKACCQCTNSFPISRPFSTHSPPG